jgi:hypothetical protein
MGKAVQGAYSSQLKAHRQFIAKRKGKEMQGAK